MNGDADLEDENHPGWSEGSSLALDLGRVVPPSLAELMPLWPGITATSHMSGSLG